MINVDDVFISKDGVFNNKDSKIILRVLSYTGEGFDQKCFCLLESGGSCWNGYHTSLYIERYYTKLEEV